MRNIPTNIRINRVIEYVRNIVRNKKEKYNGTRSLGAPPGPDF